MKIAIFYHLPFGGAKRVVQEHIKGLVGLGHTVDLYSTSNENDIFDPGKYASNEYIYPFKQKVSNIPFLKSIQRDFTIFFTLQKHHQVIADYIDKQNYDIVLVHTDSYTQAPFILRFLKTNNVYFCLEPLRMVYEYSLGMPDSLHGINRVYESLTRKMRKEIDQKNARSAKNILAISHFGREYLIHAFNLYPQIAYLGVDEKLFRPKKLEKKKQVLFVAEKEYIYGYDLAEKAMQLIPRNIRPSIKFVFGTKREQRITDEELVDMYNESTVALSLSRYDTFGLVPLESMACSVPIIALKVAGYRETIIDNKTGFLVDFDPQAIAEKIMLLVSDETINKKMGERGREWVLQKWTWKLQMKHLEKLLTDFTKKR